MSAKFLGFDHVDTRVTSIAAVEPFYDKLMSLLGMSHKRYCHVDAQGEWHDASDERPYNTVEYFEDAPQGGVACFIGFIEDRLMRPTGTRIAFRVAAPLDTPFWLRALEQAGAVRIEPSAWDDYPAIFFEDPSGTKLEICARTPKRVTLE
jgi:catechol 2,3-dioxygenase-like lactoylglutathione lyase family enzyme